MWARLVEVESILKAWINCLNLYNKNFRKHDKALSFFCPLYCREMAPRQAKVPGDLEESIELWVINESFGAGCIAEEFLV